MPDVKGQTIVDVGSRLGPVLWNGYLFSHAKQLIGIELNKTFAALAQQIVDTNKFDDRIKVINDNVLNQAETLKTGDVVILNNVFEWFTSQEELRKMWDFVVSSITKKGAIVVTSPSIEESLQNAGVRLTFVKSLNKAFFRTFNFESDSDFLFFQLLQITDIDISKWVSKVDVRYPEPPPHHHGDNEDHDDDGDCEDVDPFFESVREIHLYKVL